MTAYTRREFGKMVIATAPLTSVIGSSPLVASAPRSLVLGVTTYSYRDLIRVPGQDNVDDVIRALRESGVAHIELAAVNVEPAGPITGPAAPPKPTAYPRNAVTLSPQEIAAIRAVVRANARRWRLSTDPARFQSVAARFAQAGIALHAYAIEFDADFTDDELDATFRQAKALGVQSISSPMTMDVARRVAPFAERHQLPVAIHNQLDGNKAGLIGASQLGAALAISPALAVKLDIGTCRSRIDCVTAAVANVSAKATRQLPPC
jgi:hypothetical protein